MAGYYKFELTDPFDCSRSIAIEVSNIFTRIKRKSWGLSKKFSQPE